MIAAFFAKLGKTILGYALQYGGQLLLEAILNLIKKFKREKEQEAAKEKLEEVVKDPNSKPEDRARAYEDYINS